jgi:hypothetical protein
MTPEQKTRLAAFAGVDQEPREKRRAFPSRRTLLLIVLAALTVAVAILGLRLLANRARPPANLSATEAADLACFQGWTVSGAPAYVPRPQGVFVADLSQREARDYLQGIGVTIGGATDGLGGFVGRTYVVVAHGPVVDGLSADAATRGEGLVLVVDADGTVRYTGIGPPWDTTVPPRALSVATADAPRLEDVSFARARVELGGRPPIELAQVPDGLRLWRISIHPPGIPVDPSGTTYPGPSVTLAYADSTGRPRLWLSQPAADVAPRVPGRPLLFPPPENGVTRYSWHAGSWEIDGFSWRYQGHALFLMAEPGPDLTLDAIQKSVLARSP